MRSGFRWCKTGKRRPVLALLAAVVLGTSGCVVADGLRLEAVPGGPYEETLTGVAGTGPGNVWAVGRAEPDLRHNRPLLLHWTGKGWHPFAVPLGRGVVTASLAAVDVVSPTQAWAVGYESVSSGPVGYGGVYTPCPECRPLLMRWDGRTWTRANLPPLSTGGYGVEIMLLDVEAVSARDVWAVGSWRWQPRPGTPAPPPTGTLPLAPVEPYVLHYDGTAWRQLTAFPPIENEATQFSAVSAAAPDAVFAIGTATVVGDPAHVVAARWDRRGWQTAAHAPRHNAVRHSRDQSDRSVGGRGQRPR